MFTNVILTGKGQKTITSHRGVYIALSDEDLTLYPINVSKDELNAIIMSLADFCIPE